MNESLAHTIERKSETEEADDAWGGLDKSESAGTNISPEQGNQGFLNHNPTNNQHTNIDAPKNPVSDKRKFGETKILQGATGRLLGRRPLIRIL